MNVIKRDGTVQAFDFGKILLSISKAFGDDQVPDKFLEQLRSEFDYYILHNKNLHVDEIHDIVQKLLIKKNKYDVVERFIWWRKKREETRENNSELVKEISSALQASNVQNQNANVDEASFGGRFGEAARVVSKKDALKKVSKRTRLNHENNRSYIHDLDSYSVGEHNCLSVPLDDLLKNGVKTRQVDIRPAASVNTAFQLIAVFFQLQSLQQFGGVAATHIDWTLEPYVRVSFFKHFLDGLKYCEEMSDEEIEKFKENFEK